MKLVRLRVINFRCHNDKTLHIMPNITPIVGANGSGKTSLLEAIYIALRGKSWRASDKDILKSSEDFYRIEIFGEDFWDEVITYDGKKSFVINDKKYIRLPRDYKYPVVLFDPRDMNLVYSSPTRRRDYLDGVIEQVFAGYSAVVSKYEKAVRQRNELLKNEYVEAGDVFSWDVLLAKYGLEIVRRRAEFVEKINQSLSETYKSIAGKDDKVAVMYDGATDMDESKYLSLLAGGFERDRMTGWTNFGPHRDLVEFLFRDTVAEDTASRGEVRSMILALKFIEARWIEELKGVKPVVLLDDVFSELDEVRRERLMKNFEEHQIILSGV